MNKIHGNRTLLLELLVLIFLPVCIFGQTLQFDFVWDDKLLIENNPYFLQPFSLIDAFSGTLWSFSSYELVMPFYRPIVVIFYYLQVKLWNFDPTGFHAVNLSLFLLSVFLLWKLCLRFQLPVWGRRIACLLFILHPAQVSCVSFISCQGDLLALFFILLTMIIWTGNHQRWMAFATALMAMLSKEAGVMIVPTLVLYDLFRNNKSVRDLKTWLPLTLAPLYFIFRHLGLSSTSVSAYNAAGLKFFFNPGGATRTFEYLSRIIFPIPTSQSPEATHQTLLISLFLVFALLLLIWIVYKKNKNHGLRQFCLFWFLLTLFPISNWVGDEVRFSDQLLFIPLVPLSIWVGSFQYENKKTRYGLLAFLGLCLMVSMSQVPAWKTDLSFWTHELKFKKNDAQTTLNYVAAYVDEIKPENSCELFFEVEKPLKIKYDPLIHSLMLYNLGNCYLPDRPDFAEQYYKSALAIDPNQRTIKNNLVGALTRQGKLQEALPIALQLAKDYPKLIVNWRNLGTVQAKMKDFDAALASFQRAKSLDPNNSEIIHMIDQAEKLKLKMQSVQ